MINQKNGILRKICLWLGVGLIVAAAGLLVGWQWRLNSSQRKTEYYVDTIRKAIPQSQGAILEERRDNTMSTFSIDGTDFVGILEIPRFESALPICANWGEISKYPCLFSGSVYNRTIQIGATSQRGQYDFYRELSVGDSLFFTDMEGNRFSYEITDIRYENHANQSVLQSENSALTLFIKNVYGFEYIIIHCDTLR